MGSEQQLVDCDKSDSGCGGGLMEQGFTYAQGAAMCTESSYSYTGSDGSCHASSCTTGVPRGGVTGYTKVSGGESGLMSALQRNPVSVAIEADQSAFSQYRGGVLTSGCGQQLDHGVTVVGYGTDGGNAYWLIKNSWGTSFGENGYIRVGRSGNQCGVTNDASYPTVSGSGLHQVLPLVVAIPSRRCVMTIGAAQIVQLVSAPVICASAITWSETKTSFCSEAIWSSFGPRDG